MGQQILAWEDNIVTPEIDGFTTGHEISFRYWDTSEQVELPGVDIGYIDWPGFSTSGLFSSSEFCGVDLSFNRAPYFTSDPVAVSIEDQEYIYECSSFDLDHIYLDSLFYSPGDLPSWLTFSDNGDGSGLFTGTPLNEDVGFHDIVLIVTDLGGLTAEQSFTLEVVNTNEIGRAHV